MASNTNVLYDNGSIDITATADEAIASSYLALKIATDGDLGIADSGDRIIGFAQDAYADEAEVTARIQGVSFGRIASGSINAGVPVMAANNGYLTASTDGSFTAGITLAAASGVDAVVPVLILPGGYQIEDVV